MSRLVLIEEGMCEAQARRRLQYLTRFGGILGEDPVALRDASVKELDVKIKRAKGNMKQVEKRKNAKGRRRSNRASKRCFKQQKSK